METSERESILKRFHDAVFNSKPNEHPVIKRTKLLAKYEALLEATMTETQANILLARIEEMEGVTV